MINFRKLKIYERALNFSKDIYDLTEGFPETERFGLISQQRRAAVSVFSNIAEGAARETYKELIRFLTMAVGSLTEIEAQLDFPMIMSYSSKAKIESLQNEAVEIRKMILMYQKRLRNTHS